MIRVHPIVLDESPSSFFLPSVDIVDETNAIHTPEFTAIFVCKWVYEAMFMLVISG